MALKYIKIKCVLCHFTLVMIRNYFMMMVFAFQAIGFDDGGQYSERLQTSLHRLELRAELYKSPERIEDKAAMIIEQVHKKHAFWERSLL